MKTFKLQVLRYPFILFVFLFGTVSAQSQSWRSSLYPNNWSPPSDTFNFYTDAFIQDFSYAGFERGLKPIPYYNTNILDVTKPPYSADNTGDKDVTLEIQNAIDDAKIAGGGVVFLPAGTYKISNGSKNSALVINGSNIVLRGAGKGKTFIYNNDTKMNRKTVISLIGSGSNWDSRPSSHAKITKDLMGPTTLIPVDNPELFKVGDKVLVRHMVTQAWATENKEPEWGTGSFPSSLDGIMHYRLITAIDYSTKTITIDAPTRFVLKTRDDASVYLVPALMVTYSGLEDFSIANREIITNEREWLELDPFGNPSTTDLDNNAHTSISKGAYDTDGCFTIDVEKAENCWIRNVGTYLPEGNIYKTHILSNGIYIAQCSGITVENCYFGYSQYGGGSGNGYGYRVESNDCLLMNDTAEHFRHGFVFARMYSHGNVFHKNKDINTGKCTGNSINGLKTGASGSDFHQWFSPSNLVDQMDLDRSYYSVLHRKGVGSNHNAVTSHSVLWNTTANSSSQGYGIRSSQSRYGYVIGTQGTSYKVNYKLSDKVNFDNLAATGISAAFRYDSDGSRTAPEDIVEGELLGATLFPQSLYLDQLERRKSQIVNTINLKNFQSIYVYPNPSIDGRFTLSKDIKYIIYDEMGRKIVNGQGTTIDLHLYPKGIYILKSDGVDLRLVR